MARFEALLAVNEIQASTSGHQAKSCELYLHQGTPLAMSSLQACGHYLDGHYNH
jgi:hypothetical protein